MEEAKPEPRMLVGRPLQKSRHRMKRDRSRAVVCVWRRGEGRKYGGIRTELGV